MRLLFVILLCSQAYFLPLSAQSAFSASPTLVEAVKPASSFVFYNYTQFENNSDGNLAMRWVRTDYEVFDSNGNSLGQDFGEWEIAVQDPKNFYNPANTLDSADFILPPVTGSLDKFILQLFPNNQAGELYMQFAFFPIDDPDDVLLIDFHYTASDVVTNTQSVSPKATIRLYPNPATDRLFVDCPDCSSEFPIRVFSASGQLIRELAAARIRTEGLSLAQLPSGSYYLEWVGLPVKSFIKR